MIFDRRTQEYTKEKDSAVLRFLYNTVIGRLVLKLLTFKWLTSLGAAYMNSRLSKRRINKFVSNNKIDMGEYQEEEYASFNDFFIRKIKEGKRVIGDGESCFLAPSDSRVTVYEIDNNTVLSIKNSKYTIDELVKDNELADKYKGGYCFVYRLCVDDYHRYYFIDSGTIKSKKKIKGKFHTVQPIAFKKYKVFSENSRECTVFETDNFGTITQIEVGALMVGKICNHDIETFRRGEEKGFFCFGGSTVVMLVEKDRVIVDQDILENSKKDIETRVLLFDVIGKKS